jgi:exonuclease SbcC
MIPVRLAVSGFLSYLDPIVVDFSQLDLACISGENGAGKSSLLDAITWGLFGQARKRDDSIINTRATTAEVVIDFIYEGNLYRIQRSKTRDKPTILEFFIQSTDGSWKPLTEKSLRETEIRIQSTLRLDYDTFINASFFLQGKADQFAQQRPSDRKRILSSILGLEIWETYREAAATRRKNLESTIANLDGKLQEIQLELNEEPQRITQLKEKETYLEQLITQRKHQSANLEKLKQISASIREQRRLFDLLERQLQTTRQNLLEQEERLATRIEECKTLTQKLERAEEIEAAYKKWQESLDALREWEKAASKFHEQETQRHALVMEIETAHAQLTQEKMLLENERDSIENEKNQLTPLEKELEQAQQNLASVNTLLSQRNLLEQGLQKLRQAQADAKAENPILKSQMEELKSRIDQLDQVEGAVCPLCSQSLSPEHRQSLVKELTSQGKNMGERYRENLALLKNFDQQVQELEEKIRQTAKAEIEARELTRLTAELNSRLTQNRQKIDQWENIKAVRLKEISRQLETKNFACKARKQLNEIDKALEAIGYNASAHDAARQTELENRSADEEKRSLEIARATLAPVQREIQEIEEHIKSLQNEVSRQQNEYNQAATALATAEAQTPDLDSAERELLNLQEQENRQRADVGAARQRVIVLDELKSRQLDMQTQRNDLILQIARYKTLERSFGKDGVPALLIEQALPEIETAANDILDRLTAGNMSVRLVTQREFKDKNRTDLKETLDILISDSTGTRDYEMFSGGEAFRVNFAIRLALSKVLSQRAGARLQTLVIDEGFGSQDALGRQRLIEAINLVRNDFAKILVITHLEELKEAFPYRIEVEKTPRGSIVHLA